MTQPTALFAERAEPAHGTLLSARTSSCCGDRDTWRADDRGEALLSPACRLDLRGVAGGWPAAQIMNLIGSGKQQQQQPGGLPRGSSAAHKCTTGLQAAAIFPLMRSSASLRLINAAVNYREEISE